MKVEQVLSTVTGRRRRGRIRRTEAARAHVLGQTTATHAIDTAQATCDAAANVCTASVATPATAHPLQVPETVQHPGTVY